jgi:hypothetical protein
MRGRVYGWIFLLVFVGAFPAPRPAAAQGAVSPGDGPYPVELRVGEIFDLCRSGQIVCPARVPICDDLTVASPVDTPDGLGFKGVAPGKTICSAASAIGLRRVFRITVLEPEKPR